MCLRFLKNLAVLFSVISCFESFNFVAAIPIPRKTCSEERKPIVIVLCRHLQTQNNMRGETHGVEGGQLDAESSKEGINSLFRFVRKFVGDFRRFYGGTDIRHYTTLCSLAFGSGIDLREVYRMPNFDEFNLGVLGGLSEKEVMKNPEFKKLFKDPDYRIHDKDGGFGDSINSVRKKFIDGIGHVIREAIRSDSGGIYMICTSRITMNIALRVLLQNDEFLDPKIPNCGAYMFKYTPNGTELYTHKVNIDGFSLLNEKIEILSEKTEIPCLEALSAKIGSPVLNHAVMLKVFAEQFPCAPTASVTPNPLALSTEGIRGSINDEVGMSPVDFAVATKERIGVSGEYTVPSTEYGAESAIDLQSIRTDDSDDEREDPFSVATGEMPRLGIRRNNPLPEEEGSPTSKLSKEMHPDESASPSVELGLRVNQLAISSPLSEAQVYLPEPQERIKSLSQSQGALPFME